MLNYLLAITAPCLLLLYFNPVSSLNVQAHGTQQAQIPLYFRPNDPYAHPIFLDRILTNNFVLEVTKTTDNGTLSIYAYTTAFYGSPMIQQFCLTEFVL